MTVDEIRGFILHPEQSCSTDVEIMAEELLKATKLIESFVKKVEEGKAKSVDTYTKYKDFLNSLK